MLSSNDLEVSKVPIPLTVDLIEKMPLPSELTSTDITALINDLNTELLTPSLYVKSTRKRSEDRIEISQPQIELNVSGKTTIRAYIEIKKFLT